MSIQGEETATSAYTIRGNELLVGGLADVDDNATVVPPISSERIVLHDWIADTILDSYASGRQVVNFEHTTQLELGQYIRFNGQNNQPLFNNTVFEVVVVEYRNSKWQIQAKEIRK